MENKPPKLIDRSTAWGCLMTNLLVLPGLGSLAIGQRVGWAHVLMSLGGLVFMMVWIGWFILSWVQHEQVPHDKGPYFWLAMLGVLLFIASWTWSLMSSIELVRKAPQRE